ncbi:MAG: CBS domain-containing protein [Nitratireductor sp.]|nr:CBS domain-containing protein [Nitratireductor sp.]
MAHNTGATQLMAIDAVAFDVETTSLNAAEARIVQIGALRINRGRIDSHAHVDKIIDPHIPVPAESTAIHGITNAQTRLAPDLKKAWPGMIEFIRDRIMIGHTIAYDLTVLAHEAARHGLAWEKPRSLCVRLLAPIALPDLHDPTLDKLAAWFDIRIDQRHSALSDSIAAAEIFLKLVPLLKEKGITTLAEAERAILMRNTAGIRQGEDAGWQRPVIDPAEAALAGGIRNYDTYAYRHCVGDVMTRTPFTVRPEASLQDAIEIMTGKGISSVLVSRRESGGHPVDDYAIITERDVMRQIARAGASALGKKAGSVAIAPLLTVREGAFVYRAMSRMRRLKVRHLAVTDDAMNLTGMLSARDLLKLRADAAIALDDAIDDGASAADLASAWGTLPAVVHSLIAEKLDAHTVTRIVSEEIRAMTGRAAILAEQGMQADGFGAPPCPYAVIVLGSGGRGESLLKPDQDNAIIFETGDPGGAQDQWFAELGSRMAETLNEAGIPFCDGGIMAKNDAWRGSVATWQARLAEWVGHANPENLLNVDIFFDQTPVHGARQLSAGLFETAYQMGSQSIPFARALGANASQVSNPFTLFGNIRAENNRLDLKLHGLFPLVSGVRALAIRHNIARHATRHRLEGLIALDRGDTGLMARLIDDHAFLLECLLKSQEREVATGHKPGNFVNLGAFDRPALTRLKSALSDIQYLPQLIQDLMF